MCKENNPMISVIVPVYNSEAVLQKCLDSILHQTFRNFELVLIDDGSTDRSGSICDQIAAVDNRVRVFHEENGGVSKARNTGIRRAKGEWVTFVDHDDMLPLDAFSCFSEYIVRKDIDIIQGQIYILREGKEVSVNSGDDEEKSVEIIDIYEYSRKGGTFRTNVWGKLYRKRLLKNCAFPAGHYCEDIYFNGLYFSNQDIKSAAIVKTTTYIYNDNGASSSHNWNVLDYYDMCRVMAALYEKVKNRTKSSKLVSEYLQLFFTQYYSFRYNIKLRHGHNGRIKKNMSILKRRYEKELLFDRNISIRKKVVLLVMANVNIVYRLWIIIHDPTMLTYEKNVKEMMKV